MLKQAKISSPLIQQASPQNIIHGSGFYLQDNRPKATTQKKEVKALEKNSSTPVQLQRYSVVREIPLVPHTKTKDISAPSEKKKVRDKTLGYLRGNYPVPADIQGTPEQLDAHRGGAFAAKKLQLEADVVGNATINLPGAHVARIATHERSRAGTTQAALINRITTLNNHWIGAHLVKREWGGEDNMWNVVAWPKKAEDAWAAGFENPIDIYFANSGDQTINIGIHIEKEDEAITPAIVSGLLQKNIQPSDVDETTDMGKALAEKLVELRYTANRAIESVPTTAQGRSRLGHANLSPGDTDWHLAKDGAMRYVSEGANQEKDNLTRKGLNPEKAKNLKGSATKEKNIIGKRSEERANAWKQETNNYKPGYDHFNNVD